MHTAIYRARARAIFVSPKGVNLRQHRELIKMKWILRYLICWSVLVILVAPTATQARHHPRTECDFGITSNGPPDPGATGPFSTVRADYNFGDAAANLKSMEEPVEWWHFQY